MAKKWRTAALHPRKVLYKEALAEAAQSLPAFVKEVGSTMVLSNILQWESYTETKKNAQTHRVTVILCESNAWYISTDLHQFKPLTESEIGELRLT